MRSDAITQPLAPTSLRVQVYDVLRELLEHGDLRGGEVFDLKSLSERLGVSRTPLREALLKLEVEGFVTIRPRSGVIVRRLTERDIRNLYQMIGALESSVLLSEADALNEEVITEMRRWNEASKQALASDDFASYYTANLALHNSYLNLSRNDELIHDVKIMKQRLYDFPRRRGFIREWEEASTGEHDAIVRWLEKGDATAAAEVVRDVHWNFEVQERFIRMYYLGEMES